MSIDKKLERLYGRRADATYGSTLSEMAKTADQSKNLKYVHESMLEVDPRSTALIKDNGTRVQNQLAEALSTANVNFDNQGSVTNNTHIKSSSDIDLLLVNGDFFTQKDAAYPEFSLYQGDPKQDIVGLKNKAATELSSRFWAATVFKGAKAVKISGGSLTKPVDVVPCNLIKGKAYRDTNNKQHLGIRVYDTDEHIWIENYPFMHNMLIDQKDLGTLGTYKKIVRLLKNLKEDADVTPDISSYNICALVYHCQSSDLRQYSGDLPLAFLNRFLSYSRRMETDGVAHVLTKVPVGNRELFWPAHSDGIKTEELKKLNNELESILVEVQRETNTMLYKTRFPQIYRMLSEGL